MAEHHQLLVKLSHAQLKHSEHLNYLSLLHNWQVWVKILVLQYQRRLLLEFLCDTINQIL